MSPRQTSKKSKNNRKNSNANLKKKVVSPTESNENITVNPVQSNSIENSRSSNNKKSQPVENKNTPPAENKTSQPIENIMAPPVDILTQMNGITPSTLDTKPVVYEITTTYKTELIECTVDPDTGDIIEVITEIYVTDAMNLKKPEQKVTEPLQGSAESVSNSVPPVQDLDLDEILKQLNMGTEICKELLK